MKLEWNRFNGSPFLHRADGVGAVYLTMGESAHIARPKTRLYAMNPHSPVCPVNRDRAMQYREFDSVTEARAVAQQWEDAFVDFMVGALESEANK